MDKLIAGILTSESNKFKKERPPLSRSSQSSSPASFSATLEQTNHLYENQASLAQSLDYDNETIEKLMDEVFKLGEGLKEDHALHSMKEYKKAVKKFLDAVMQKAYKQCQVKGVLNPRTMLQREYSLVRIVDTQLDSLARAVLSEQSSALAILERVDEIKGLIIDYLR